MKPYGLKLERDERILWMGKRCIGSLWLPFIIGILTLPLYGIGVLFILYAISKWLKTDYIITDRKVAKITRHYAFVYLLSYDVEEIKREEIKSMYTLQTSMGRIFHYYDMIIENKGKLIFKGIKYPEEVKKFIKIS